MKNKLQSAVASSIKKKYIYTKHITQNINEYAKPKRIKKKKKCIMKPSIVELNKDNDSRE